MSITVSTLGMLTRSRWIPNKEDLAKPTRDIETPAAAEEKAALLSTPSAP